MGAVKRMNITVTPMKRIPAPGGDVLHAIKRTDPGYVDFGEAYFSWVNAGATKAWKMHSRMTLNLVVPLGMVRFVFHLPDAAEGFRVEEIGESRYARLTVPPGLWFGFKGLAASPSLVMNVADIPHDPAEARTCPLADIPYPW